MKAAACAFGALIVLLATSCAGWREAGAVVDAAGRLGSARCAPGSVKALRSESAAYAGVVRSTAIAFRTPGGRVLHRFSRTNENRHVTVFGVLGETRNGDCSPRWYRVQLPLRPNGVTGWVRASELELFPVQTRIEIDLSDRTLVLRRNGRPVLRTTIGIGAPATPTPVGRFYVNQRIRALNPTGPYGPGAVGFSAFSDVLTNWTQGGPVAIHGTNAPATIGVAASHGCLHVRNDVLLRLFAAALPGTPVVVRP